MATTVNSSMGEQFKKQLATKKLTFKSVTAMLLFGAIVMVFVFFGLPGKMGLSIGSAGSVNGVIISVSDLKTEEERVQQYYASMFGGKMDFSNQRNLLRQQAVENLIQMEVLSQATQHEGIVISDAEVRDYIVKEIPFLQKDGMFQRDYYSRYLEMNKMAPVDFESKVRKSMASFRARELFESASKVTMSAQAKQEQLKQLQMNISFVKIDQDELVKKTPALKDKFEEILKKMEAAVKASDEAGLQASMKELGVSWEETGSFDLSADMVPKIAAPELMNTVADLSLKTPYVDHFVMAGAQKYVVKLKSVKNTDVKAEASKDSNLASKVRANSLFETWVQQNKKSAKISINPQVMQN